MFYLYQEGSPTEGIEKMTTTTATVGTHGLSERGALAYLYWPLAMVSIYTLAQAEGVIHFVGSLLGL